MFESVAALVQRGFDRCVKNRALSSSAVFLAVASALLMGCSGPSVDPFVVGEEREEIVGGTEADEGAWPTVVAVSLTSWIDAPFWCGGTLISPTRVLTAGHCIFDDQNASHYEVIAHRHDLTSGDGEVVGVTGITLHPNYVDEDALLSPENDVAILELASSVGGPFSRLVSSGRMSEILAGNDSTVLGWGTTSFGGSHPNTLQEVTVDVIGRGAVCDAASDYTGVTNNEICIGDLAGGHDSCQGDSGGPAFVKKDNEWFLLGVVSWGEFCAEPDLPGIYSYLPNYVDWVKQNAPDAPAPSWLPSAQIATSIL